MYLKPRFRAHAFAVLGVVAPHFVIKRWGVEQAKRSCGLHMHRCQGFLHFTPGPCRQEEVEKPWMTRSREPHAAAALKRRDYVHEAPALRRSQFRLSASPVPKRLPKTRPSRGPGQAELATLRPGHRGAEHPGPRQAAGWGF